MRRAEEWKALDSDRPAAVSRYEEDVEQAERVQPAGAEYDCENPVTSAGFQRLKRRRIGDQHQCDRVLYAAAVRALAEAVERGLKRREKEARKLRAWGRCARLWSAAGRLVEGAD